MEVDRLPADLVLRSVERWIEVRRLTGRALDSANKGHVEVLARQAPGADLVASVVSLGTSRIPTVEAALASPGVQVYFGVVDVAMGTHVLQSVDVPVAIDDAGFTWLGSSGTCA